MGSQGGGRSGEANGEQHLLQTLSRQGSLYGLTLDEVQNQLGGLGKPLGSMNLDELLRSVWSTEVNVAPPGSDANPSAPQPGSIQTQGSFTLSRDLSKKTVDEVWRDIQQGTKKMKKKKKKGSTGVGTESEGDNHHRHHQERQPTFGELTLEDFLAKAGVVAESTNAGTSRPSVPEVDPISAPQQAQWMHYQLSLAQHQPPPQNQQKVMTVFVPSNLTVQQPIPVGPTSVLDVAYPDDAHLTLSPSSLMGTLSDTQTPGRKRVASGVVVEKTVERRQKRMIKNRESAARSRARKQAYTHELENKVSRLEEENERLRRQREAEKVVPCAPPPEPRNQLRRTSSAPF